MIEMREPGDREAEFTPALANMKLRGATSATLLNRTRAACSPPGSAGIANMGISEFLPSIPRKKAYADDTND